jgi:hypothetical protein
MNEKEITFAQYVAVTMPDGTTENTTIKATIDGKELYVPLDPGNRHYAEIMRQVDAGTLTIADAE